MRRGRAGCLAGPVFAAAVMLPPDFHDPLLNDSKQMTERNREKLRAVIEREAVAWAVEAVSAERIDEINILNASFEGMSLAAARLDPAPGFLAIDGNRFRTRSNCLTAASSKATASMPTSPPLRCWPKRTATSIMLRLAEEFPQYGWRKNKGYPTREHRLQSASTVSLHNHRLTFNHEIGQLELAF